MIKKTRKNSKIWMGICVILLVVILAESLYSIWLFQRYEETLQASRMAAEQAASESQKTVENLEKKLKKRTEQLKQKTEEAEALAKQLSHADEGQITPPSGFTGNPGDLVDPAVLSDPSPYFQSYEILRDGEIFQRIYGKSYQDNPHVALEDLRYLRMLHYNFDHQIQIGEMIVHKDIAQDVLGIFQELLNQQYEIYSMYLIDNYWVEGQDGNAADFQSIEVNNTSCFNYRPVSGGTSLSNHGYGRAIDINPMNNPYVTASGEFSHENAAPYVNNRDGQDPHVVVEGDICYQTFAAYGFSWGGLWQDPIDYQHFEKPMV